jgi:hypothetical protein
MVKFNVGKLKSTTGERPQITVEGLVIADDNGRTVLRYDIPVTEYLANVTDIKTKAGGETSGCGIILGGVDFDFNIDAMDEKGNPVEHEARLRFEPTWRGMWSGLKLHKILETKPRAADHPVPESN